MLQGDSSIWDQNAFNDLARRDASMDPTPNRLFKCAPSLPHYKKQQGSTRPDVLTCLPLPTLHVCATNSSAQPHAHDQRLLDHETYTEKCAGALGASCSWVCYQWPRSPAGTLSAPSDMTDC